MGDEVIHRHLNDADKHSLEIGTPGKGGTIKVFVDIDSPQAAVARIDRMLLLRAYADTKKEEVFAMTQDQLRSELTDPHPSHPSPPAGDGTPPETPSPPVVSPGDATKTSTPTQDIIREVKKPPESRAPKPPVSPAAPSEAKEPAQPVPSGEFQCADCGCDISNTQKKIGETFAGRPVCPACLDKLAGK